LTLCLIAPALVTALVAICYFASALLPQKEMGAAVGTEGSCAHREKLEAPPIAVSSSGQGNAKYNVATRELARNRSR
jgi:hypothetical protein